MRPATRRIQKFIIDSNVLTEECLREDGLELAESDAAGDTENARDDHRQQQSQDPEQSKPSLSCNSEASGTIDNVRATLQLFVDTLTGNTCAFAVAAPDIIDVVKAKI